MWSVAAWLQLLSPLGVCTGGCKSAQASVSAREARINALRAINRRQCAKGAATPLLFWVRLDKLAACKTLASNQAQVEVRAGSRKKQARESSRRMGERGGRTGALAREPETRTRTSRHWPRTPPDARERCAATWQRLLQARNSAKILTCSFSAARQEIGLQQGRKAAHGGAAGLAGRHGAAGAAGAPAAAAGPPVHRFTSSAPK